MYFPYFKLFKPILRLKITLEFVLHKMGGDLLV